MDNATRARLERVFAFPAPDKPAGIWVQQNDLRALLEAYDALLAERAQAESDSRGLLTELEEARDDHRRQLASVAHTWAEAQAQISKLEAELQERVRKDSARLAEIVRLESDLRLAADRQAQASPVLAVLERLVKTTNRVIDTIGPQLELIHEPGVERLAATASQALALLDAEQVLAAWRAAREG